MLLHSVLISCFATQTRVRLFDILLPTCSANRFNQIPYITSCHVMLYRGLRGESGIELYAVDSLVPSSILRARQTKHMGNFQAMPLKLQFHSNGRLRSEGLNFIKSKTSRLLRNMNNSVVFLLPLLASFSQRKHHFLDTSIDQAACLSHGKSEVDGNHCAANQR